MNKSFLFFIHFRAFFIFNNSSNLQKHAERQKITMMKNMFRCWPWYALPFSRWCYIVCDFIKVIVNKTRQSIININKNLTTKIKLKDIDQLWKRSDYIYKKNKKFGFFSDHWGKPITQKSIGSYKDILSLKEINLININCKQILNSFEYN